MTDQKKNSNDDLSCEDRVKLELIKKYVHPKKVRYWKDEQDQWKFNVDDMSEFSLSKLPWYRLKKRIDSVLDPKETFECQICCEESGRRIFCTECDGYFCLMCYMNIIIKGQGLFTCPFCRMEDGKRVGLLGTVIGLCNMIADSDNRIEIANAAPEF